jgi:hypothetical protein
MTDETIITRLGPMGPLVTSVTVTDLQFLTLTQVSLGTTSSGMLAHHDLTDQAQGQEPQMTIGNSHSNLESEDQSPISQAVVIQLGIKALAGRQEGLLSQSMIPMPTGSQVMRSLAYHIMEAGRGTSDIDNLVYMSCNP